MWNCVEEIIYESESRPIINYDAVKVYDQWTNKFYVYGGMRWRNNENKNSPTSKPNSDFFCFRYYPEPRWQNYTDCMRADSSLISPFENTLTRPESTRLDLPPLSRLPALRNAIGTIVRDNTASKTSYLLILGVPVGRQFETCQHPLLLCINLTLNTWRFIHLKGHHKVPNGRAHGSMIVAGEMQSTTSDLYLCVFGGRNDTSNTYMDTYAVANLSAGAWTIPNGKIPDGVGPLGMNPGLEKFQTTKDGHEKILIIKGALGPTAERAKVDFSRVFLFDPQVRINRFSQVDVDAVRCPGPAKRLVIQPIEAQRGTDFMIITCGHQRPLNEFPTRNASEPNHVSLYIRPEVKIWIAEIREGESEEEKHSREQVQPMNKEAESRADNDSSSDESSSSSSGDSDNRAMRRSRFLAERAVRSAPKMLRKSGKVLIWKNMTSGRVKRWFDNLTGTFRVEGMILSGIISHHFDPTSCSYNHLDFPRLILIGSDHRFLGEVRTDIYNAVAPISLNRLMEAVDDNTNADVDKVLEDDHMSARSTEYESSGAESAMEGLEDDLRLSDEEIPAERAWSPGLSGRSTLPVYDVRLNIAAQSIPESRCFGRDDLDDDNLDYEVMFSAGVDTFLLEQEPESDVVNPPDPEIESIVQNAMDIWDPSQDGDLETSSDVDVEMEQMFQNPYWITG